MDLVDGVLYGADRDIIEFVRQRIPQAQSGFASDAVALGVVRHGRLLGGAVFDQYTEFQGQANIVMSAAFDSPAWCTRKTMRRLYGYPFIQIGCRRMTTITRADNVAARSADERMGFIQEGVIRKYFPGDVDAILYGMLREECRWIKD